MWQGVSALSSHEGIISPAYTVCIPSPEIDGEFASYLFKLPKVIHLFYCYSQGLTSDTWNLKFHHFAEVQVYIPEVDEQIAIASVLAALDKELAIQKKQRNALVQQKRGLMQKLLTGQWRVTVPTSKEVPHV
jgi:type I restriction enzyme S subunit